MTLLVMAERIVRGDYKSVGICILALLLFCLTGLAQWLLRMVFPAALEILFLFFIFAAQIMGEVQEYYLCLPFWDVVLHTVSGFLFAAIGYSLPGILSCGRDQQTAPLILALTAFCFSVTVGVLWEFFEWGMDSFLALDMQKDTVVSVLHSVALDPQGHNIPHTVANISGTALLLDNGTRTVLPLQGYLDLGLQDTMQDLLVNCLGAAVFSALGLLQPLIKGAIPFATLFIPIPKER